jgi:hypothetical protein
MTFPTTRSSTSGCAERRARQKDMTAAGIDIYLESVTPRGWYKAEKARRLGRAPQRRLRRERCRGAGQDRRGGPSAAAVASRRRQGAGAGSQ